MVTTQPADLSDAMLNCKISAKSRRPSSAASTPLVSAGSTSATASRACGYGSNFRLTELQSAIGRIQLQRLPDWTVARLRNALLLAEALGDLSAVRVPLPPEGIEHAWYKFYAFVKPVTLLTAGAVIASSPKSLPMVIQPSPAAAVRSTWKSVSSMQASPPPSGCLLPVNSATPA